MMDEVDFADGVDGVDFVDGVDIWGDRGSLTQSTWDVFAVMCLAQRVMRLGFISRGVQRRGLVSKRCW
jgi:hypothetical protein